MNPQLRYQVFVSSTYEDLREERQQATQAILEAGSFPSGMELFPASDETQWELIKRVIEEADYYVVVVGGKYGSIGPDGKSYTEMEYDYAVESGVPILGFVKTEIDELPAKYVEADPERRTQLEAFRKKVMSRTCRKFSDPLELGMAVMKSLMHEARIRPRIGWVRADQARSEKDRKRELKLGEQLQEAEELIDELEREIRDRSVITDEIPREQLRQGSDLFYFKVCFRDTGKKLITEDVPVSWDEIFRIIGPSLYGYLVRKISKHNQGSSYPFEGNIEQYIRTKIIDRCQTRKLEILHGQVDTCVFQFKELGYIMFKEEKEKDGSVFRGITLTEAGEQYVALLKTEKR